MSIIESMSSAVDAADGIGRQFNWYDIYFCQELDVVNQRSQKRTKGIVFEAIRSIFEQPRNLDMKFRS